MKTSPDNITSFHYFALLRDYFNSFNFYKNGALSRNQIGRSGVQLKKKIKNSPSCVHVLNKTLNFVILRCRFAEDGKEMYKNVKHIIKDTFRGTRVDENKTKRCKKLLHIT